jgi:hypothetical protein
MRRAIALIGNSLPRITTTCSESGVNRQFSLGKVFRHAGLHAEVTRFSLSGHEVAEILEKVEMSLRELFEVMSLIRDATLVTRIQHSTVVIDL